MKFFAAFLVSVLVAACGNAKEPAHDCGSETAAGVSYKYCIDRPARNSSGDVMFYFHGLSADEEEFSKNYGATVLDKLVASGRAPIVISVSFGPLWFLTDAATPVHPALHALVVNTIMPQLEAKLSHPVRHRLLMGESMGGFNAIQLLTKDSSLFTNAVLLCPAVSTLSPWSTDDQIKQYAATHDGVSEAQLLLARKLAQTEFPSQPDWITHDPLQLVLAVNAQTPPFFISGGTKDEWGFYEGQNLFADLAQAHGASVEWMSIPDKGHCIQNDDSWAALVTFLTKVEHAK